MQRYFILLGTLVFLPLSVSAVCQETDEYGNVSYVDCSNAKTEDAIPVDIQPINTADPKKKRLYRSRSSKIGKKSSASQKKQDRAAKRKELEAAKKALEQAKEVGEGDRQKTVTGSKLSEQYLNRVKAAEERVKAAEESLK